MPAGGTLTIRTANAAYRERYAGPDGVIEAGHYVVLSVSDTGHGMDASVRAHIFEPFFTTKQHGKGTGLGLSTVYGIVKQSGGEIWVASEPGRGTEFQILLPRVDEPAEARDPAAPAAAPAGVETVLLAEDEDTLRALVRDILVSNGYRVIEARNGAEALQLARNCPGEIHLLITDLVMPQLSGQELARRLAPERPELKILYMSGYTDEALPVHGLAKQYLQKPFTPEMLVRQVRQLLDE
jgi:CheY-like chemotaxis protein